MRSKILEELYINKGNYISGEVLRTKLGVSRTAIWKHINALKEEGYNIETIPRKGYMLLEMKDKLLPKEIEALISNNAIGQQIVYFDSIDSTNSYAKKEANKLKDGTVILSEEQLLGRGRRGRNWSSPKGTGIWMSLVLKPNIPPTEGVKMTQIAAAAVCKSIRELTGLNALIKWPNDIVINGKKICGILTEMAGELNEVNYIIVGIGINVNTDGFSCELKEKATSLFIEGGKKIDRRELVVNILKNFEALYNIYIKDLNLDETLVIVKNYSAILGKEIKIIQGNLEKKARAIDINNEGLLLVQMDDGSKELISSGEVSIRGENGYI
ncbi:biotin--[acetyl-CoA-carboxylase] ligase [Alkaliphilus sp. MSJ-5]|uniref:Bifunctional ligase/repressor BirA n=1 Tax=Alkaliphilus flagellatus TaxID=2841507 RepID=A0ABS6G3I8_9FIRM|nr:biotin--[acetyl-CoA-carboxylase] ligase [Alkaliphilus flagellatus]MBU5676277.1 biotin--[acetyl-CoA-carboxylase] ligase [Alkaliphilus flagellatus]